MASCSSTMTAATPCGFLISHSATLTNNGEQEDIYCVPGGTEFTLVKDVDNTDPFKTNTTLLVCVTCLFPLDENDKTIIERYKIGLALDKEYTGEVSTVFVSLVSPSEGKGADLKEKTIQLNIGVPRFTKIMCQEVIDFLTKYFGSSYSVTENLNGILASTTPVMLNEVVMDDETIYLVPKGTKFRFYPEVTGQKYRLFAVNSDHALLTYNKVEDVYTVPLMMGEDKPTHVFTLKALANDIRGSLTVLLTYYFMKRGIPFDTSVIEHDLKQQLGSEGFTSFKVYNIVIPSGGTNILTSSVMTSDFIPLEIYARVCRHVQGLLSTYGGQSITVLPIAGPGLLPH